MQQNCVCRVTLYQDAHQEPGTVPEVPWESVAVPENARRSRTLPTRPSYSALASAASAMSPHGMSPHGMSPHGYDSDTELGSSMHGASDDEFGSESDLSDAITLSSAGSVEDMLHLLREAVNPGSHSHSPNPNPSRVSARDRASSPSPAAQRARSTNSPCDKHITP